MGVLPVKRTYSSESNQSAYSQELHNRSERTKAMFNESGGDYDKLEVFSDLSIVIHDTDEVVAEHAFLNLLARYYPGCSIIIADELRGTWYRYFPRANPDTIDKQDEAERISSNSRERGMGPLFEAIRNVKTKNLIVMLGDSRHPAERILGILKELRNGKEIIVSTSFESLCDGGISEKRCAALALKFSKTRLSFKGLEISDPYSKFFGAQTLIIQDMLKKLARRNPRCNTDNLLYEMLLHAKSNLSFLEMRYEPYFSPGFLAAQHTG